MRKKFIAKVLTVAMMISTLGNASIYMAASAEETSVDVASYRENLNYHDDINLDLDLSFADEATSEIPRLRGTLPTSYSSSSDVDWNFEVMKDYVTSVKNQNPYGTCWAYTTISAAETSYIINEGITDVDAVDFNEYHLVHYTYDTPENPLGLFGGDSIELTSGDFLNTGGNCLLSASVLANWIGVSDSTDFTVDDVEQNNPESLGYEDAAHLEDAYYIAMPDMTSTNYQTDMNVVKNMIMQYGSLALSYYSGTAGGDEFTGYYYCPSSLYADYANHAVTIVGWDDTVPASAFTEHTGNTPAGDGAWLIKNSWGTDGDFGGYFWISYYDKSLDVEVYAYNVVGADNYDNNYQYDGATSGSCIEQKNSISQANAFVAQGYESLEAVGFYTYNTNINYEIRIYKNLESSEAPQYGDLVLTQTGKETYAGYHTIELTDKVMLAKGERYAVVVTLTKNGEVIQLPLDVSADYGWLQFFSYSKVGESYWGTSVADLYDMYLEGSGHYNVKIKAFTNEVNEADFKVTSISLNKTAATLGAGNTLQLTATATPSYAANKMVTWTSSNTNVATVDITGKVTAKAAGTAIITATAADGSGVSASCTITVEKTVYSIQYNGNGATSGSMSNLTNCQVGTSYTLTANAYKRTGYSFAGWNTKADGSGTTYKNEASVKNLTTTNGQTVTLYAQWTKTKYTIAYKLNGGTNNKSNKSSYYVTTSTLKLKNPTRAGYTFKGWYTDKKFKNKITQISKGSTKNYTLYAKWEKVSVKKTTISSAKNSKSKQIVLKYKKSSGAAGYEISYSTDKKFKKSVTKKTTKNATYTIKNLKKGKTYYVRIRAYKLDSAGKKVYSEYSKVVKVKIAK